MKKIFILMLMAALCCTCHKKNEPTPESTKSIVILYDNDVHCGVAGYTKIAGLRDAIQASDTADCLVVSAGDYLQGGNWGALSSGAYIVDMMNAVGYDAVTIGNHEFDYGTPYMLSLLESLKAPITCVNFSKINDSQQYYAPYVMTKAGGKKIAFVGVVTPTTMTSEYYSFEDSVGNVLYDLYPDGMFQLTQAAVDKARAAGADYVILLSHLGEQDANYSSIQLINNTSGIDLVLDGHTHSVIADSSAVNVLGKTVHFTQTGTQFANIGKLTISRSGEMHTELLPATEVIYTNSRVDAVYDSISSLLSTVTDERLGTSDHALTIYAADGTRIVRNQESTAGNFAADAYRWTMGAQIGVANGGGVRADLPAGDITYGDLVNVNPFFNDLELREIPGDKLRLMLEEACSMMPQENGSFLQVSGLKLTVDLTGATPAVTQILVENTETGTYEALDDSKTYTVGGTTYVFSSFSSVSSCAAQMPLILKDAGALKKYFVEYLNGDMGTHYVATEGRITIIQ